MKRFLLFLLLPYYVQAQQPDTAVSVNDTINLLPDTLIVNHFLADSATVDSLMAFDSLSLKDSLIAEADTFTFIGVGDIMLGTDYPSEKYLPPGNTCYPLLSEVKPYLKNADITFGNVEGVFAGDKGTPKHCNNPDQCYVFRMPVEYADCLTDAGFDIVSVANNHVNDFGKPGQENTVKVLEDAGLAFAGFFSHPFTIYEYQNHKIGFCAFSPNTGVVDLRDLNGALEIIDTLEKQCDIVMVSIHGGAEGKNHQHITRKDEVYLGHNRGNIYQFAHQLVDAGADIIFGHGPHVTRAMEIYNDRFIIYSLGNFCTYARFNISGPNGIAPMVKLWVNNDGKFIKGKVFPVYQSGEGGARIDPHNRAIYKLKDLTKTDFPEANHFEISDHGEINIKNVNLVDSEEDSYE
jgi:hypothetical protein